MQTQLLRTKISKRQLSTTQRGLSAIGLLGLLFIIVTVITLLLRLGPHYLDWQTMRSVFGDLPVGEVHTMSKDDIRES